MKKLKKSQIETLKKILIQKRDDLLRVVGHKKHGLPDTEIGDEIDVALQTVEKEILFELTNNEKIMLDSIEAALRKIEKGKYGLCENCNKLIAFRRLKVIPWVRYCIRCQMSVEK